MYRQGRSRLPDQRKSAGWFCQNSGKGLADRSLMEYACEELASDTAARFCCAFDELRNYLRPRRTMGEVIPLLEQRRAFLQHITVLLTWIQVAS